MAFDDCSLLRAAVRWPYRRDEVCIANKGSPSTLDHGRCLNRNQPLHKRLAGTVVWSGFPCVEQDSSAVAVASDPTTRTQGSLSLTRIWELMFLSEQPSILTPFAKVSNGHEKCCGIDMNTGIFSSKKSASWTILVNVKNEPAFVLINSRNQPVFLINRRHEAGFLMNRKNEPGYLMNRKNEPGFLWNILPLHAGQPMNVWLHACQASSGAGQPNWCSLIK